MRYLLSMEDAMNEHYTFELLPEVSRNKVTFKNHFDFVDYIILVNNVPNQFFALQIL